MTSRPRCTIVSDVFDPAAARPLICPGVTTYTAIAVGGVMPGDRVAVFGLGGLGQLALRYAQIFGGEVIVVEDSVERLSLAEKLGAAHVVHGTAIDPVAAIAALGGADVAIVQATRPLAVEQAYASLRPGGRLILISLSEDETMSVPAFRTVLKGVRMFR